MKLNQEQKDRYLADPNSCPYCAGYMISHTESAHLGNLEFVYWVCNDGNCDGKWVEQFELTDIWEDNHVSNSIE